MGKIGTVGALLAICLLASVGCASLEPAKHQYIMRGQVLDVADSMAFICIGNKDGARVGQEFSAYKFVRKGYLATKNQIPYFQKEKTGRVKIEDIFDEHYSHAKILSGSVKVHDVVELD